jgi:hypothetical protein
MHRVIFFLAFVIVTALALPASEALAAGKQKSQIQHQDLTVAKKLDMASPLLSPRYDGRKGLNTRSQKSVIGGHAR